MIWYLDKGPENDVVVSSRIRLARNFKKYPFPSRMNGSQIESFLVDIEKFIQNTELKNKLNFLRIEQMPEVDRFVMVEKHLISSELLEDGKKGAILLGTGQKASIMVNEEDHLRIQSILAGMQLENAYSVCLDIDRELEDFSEYAYDIETGYLTSCPTNAGTGLRASLMMHLPVLTMTGRMKTVLAACAKIGIVVRGMYGEHTKAKACMYQISNQVTLGQKEEEIIESINNIARQLAEEERALRKELYKNEKYRLEDKIMRSYGILQNARIISSDEALGLFSDVLLGLNMGLIKNIDINTINQLMILIQAVNLKKYTGKDLNEEERDILRAQTIRELLKGDGKYV